MVIPRGYRGYSDDSTEVNLVAKSMYIINPFTASNDNLLKSFKLSFESEPERLLNSFCSVVWKNSMLMFGGSVYAGPHEVTMLTGCKVKHFEQALPLLVSKAIYGFRGVCTTVQDKVMLCFGTR